MSKARPTARALRQAADFWSSQSTRVPIEIPLPSELLGFDWIETAWDYEWSTKWQDEADVAASAALSDAEAPRGTR